MFFWELISSVCSVIFQPALCFARIQTISMSIIIGSGRSPDTADLHKNHKVDFSSATYFLIH